MDEVRYFGLVKSLILLTVVAVFACGNPVLVEERANVAGDSMNTEADDRTVVVRFAGTDGKPADPETVAMVVKPDSVWQELLTEEQFDITTNRGTEAPNTCLLGEVNESGVFRCVRCSTDLFTNSAKFESGTGWPSYYEPISPLNVIEENDSSLGMIRTEVLCTRCNSHLGHVFDDGPPPTG